eukprot:scaffold4850_cov340-Prasinococcus_capsulatus_cf.AAC.10
MQAKVAVYLGVVRLSLPSGQLAPSVHRPRQQQAGEEQRKMRDGHGRHRAAGPALAVFSRFTPVASVARADSSRLVTACRTFHSVALLRGAGAAWTLTAPAAQAPVVRSEALRRSAQHQSRSLRAMCARKNGARAALPSAWRQTPGLVGSFPSRCASAH